MAGQRTVLVTGAASGIGEHTARRFLKRGCYVIGVDRDETRLSALQRELGEDFEPIRVDLADGREVSKQLTDGPPLDVVVNAAGITLCAAFEETSIEELRRLLDVNLVGLFQVCQLTVPRMRKGATIVNIASSVALHGHALFSAYAATKGAVVAFSRSLAVALAPDVRVNVVCPGGVDTPMVHNMARPSTEAASNSAPRSQSLLGRTARPEEVVEVIEHLASAKAGATTGLVYSVDGGASA